MFWFNEFSFGSLFISMVFFIVFGTIAFVILTSIRQWAKNNNSPELTVPPKPLQNGQTQVVQATLVLIPPTMSLLKFKVEIV